MKCYMFTDLAGLGQVVKNERQFRNYTLADLAALSRVSKGALSKIESGKGNPTIETVLKIAGALDVSFCASWRLPLPCQ